MCRLCPQGLIKHIKKKLKTKLLLKKNFLSIDIEYTSLKMNFFFIRMKATTQGKSKKLHGN
jgi:hypothetical protein